MKRAGIVTLFGEYNFGNRLQNYAVQVFVNKEQIKAFTLKNIPQLNEKNKIILRFIRYILTFRKVKGKRREKFKQFNENITFSKHYITSYSKISKKYNYFITRK